MTRRLLLTFTLAATAAVPVAAADAAKPAPYPTVTKIEPLNVGIGDTMTITGKNFVPGAKKNTIVFKRDGKRALFVKADAATRTSLTFRIPESLRKALGKKNGVAIPSKFRVRVLSRRFAKTYTSKDMSPTVAPRSVVEVLRVEEARRVEIIAQAQGITTQQAAPAAAPVAPAGSTGPGTPPPPPDCDGDGVLDADDADDDNDLMTDAFELSIKTDPCRKDTDNDGMWDVWEYESAVDLNGRNALPYPGKRPHPNALDGADAGRDWDGDGLWSSDEHALWRKYGQGAPLPLNYSDGTKFSGQHVMTADLPASLRHLDVWHQWTDTPPDGRIDDGEKDADGDRLGNWYEMNGPLTEPWWKTIKPYSEETPYFNLYDTTRWDDADTDGDGLIDGDDDQDFDGYSNVFERDRFHTGWYVHPFNPCLPNPYVERCSKYVPGETGSEPYPPFDGGTHWDDDFDDATAVVREDVPLQWPPPNADPDPKNNVPYVDKAIRDGADPTP